MPAQKNGLCMKRWLPSSSSSGDSLNLLTLLLIPIGAVWVIISHLFENRSSIKSGFLS